MSWVAQGGFMSFCGLLPATLLLSYGLSYQAVHTTLLLSGVALILLAIHVFMTGFFQCKIRPLRVGAIVELVYGLYLVTIVILSEPPSQ